MVPIIPAEMTHYSAPPRPQAPVDPTFAAQGAATFESAAQAAATFEVAARAAAVKQGEKNEFTKKAKERLNKQRFGRELPVQPPMPQPQQKTVMPQSTKHQIKKIIEGHKGPVSPKKQEEK